MRTVTIRVNWSLPKQKASHYLKPRRDHHYPGCRFQADVGMKQQKENVVGTFDSDVNGVCGKNNIVVISIIAGYCAG